MKVFFLNLWPDKGGKQLLNLSPPLLPGKKVNGDKTFTKTCFKTKSIFCNEWFFYFQVKSSSDYLQKMYSEMARVDEQLEMVSRYVFIRIWSYFLCPGELLLQGNGRQEIKNVMEKYKTVSGLRRTEGVCQVWAASAANLSARALCRATVAHRAGDQLKNVRGACSYQAKPLM